VSRVVKFEGEAVERGALLAVVESPELGEAQASVRLLQAEKEAADSNWQREATLLERRLSTAREAEVARAEAKKYDALLDAAKQKVSALAGTSESLPAARIGTHELRAPIAGTVVERNIAPGQTVEGHLVAFKIANLDHLWVELNVFERNLPHIRVGDHVELRPLAAPERAFEGRVALIGAQIDAETRSATVRIEIDNRERRLRVGQAVNATIHASGGELQPHILVPNGAVTYVDGAPTVFVSEGENAVRVAKVELGASDGKQLEILHGLSPQDSVVSEGVFALKSELFR
jgi:cobalt-zinc-cadmium efflux system membrane fusion protein